MIFIPSFSSLNEGIITPLLAAFSALFFSATVSNGPKKFSFLSLD